jgi:hypothetical protein
MINYTILIIIIAYIELYVYSVANVMGNFHPRLHSLLEIFS